MMSTEDMKELSSEDKATMTKQGITLYNNVRREQLLKRAKEKIQRKCK